ncbi:protein LEG1 homolog [Neosynchiropus ocellatus]
MLRLTACCLLLACAVYLGSSAVIMQDGAPIMWLQTAGLVTDLPIQNGVSNPDPWNFLQRLSMYRLMIGATDSLMGSMGPSANENPMWGLPLQLVWMLTSGRLADPTGATACGLQTGDPMCISTSSWWGCVSYFVSAMPFLSAAQSGLLGEAVQVALQVPEGVTEFCTTYDDCKLRYPEVMSKWDAFFQGLKAATVSPLPDNEKKDAILGLYWDAQMTSTHASAACSAKKTPYSSTELSFASSWLNSAEYVSAARFQSNLERSAKFITPLPGRILKEEDSAPNIADLSAEENHTLAVFGWMKNMNSIMMGGLVNMWRASMCSVATREKGREMLEQLLLDPSFPTSSLLSIISSMATSC